MHVIRNEGSATKTVSNFLKLQILVYPSSVYHKYFVLGAITCCSYDNVLER